MSHIILNPTSVQGRTGTNGFGRKPGKIIVLLGFTLSLLCPSWLLAVQATRSFDVVVYGGTSAGVTAAIQLKALGKSVIVIEPSKRLGGLSASGLGQTDIGNKRAIGGMARAFYHRIAEHYQASSSWTWQRREDYKDAGQTRTEKGEVTQWTFEPHVAEAVFEDLVTAAGLEVVRDERLDLNGGVEKRDSQIAFIRMESGAQYVAKMFIDATYEGDLMAAAGVSYAIGREGNLKYGESYNGVQVANSSGHNFVHGVDPYFRRGERSSGLLPGIDPAGPGEEGKGDPRVQAYCFRLCLTDVPANMIPFEKPADYDEREYELLLRNFEAGESQVPWINSPMPNRKTDINNRTGFSSDFIGQNYAYPDGDYLTRSRIMAAHRRYQEGLLWTLSHNRRVPEKIRQEVSRWGMAKDEFVESGGWPDKLYIREARRMVGSYIMTQGNCEGKERVKDSIGLAAYTMDSHNTQRYVTREGFVRNEGDIQIKGFPPYPISFRSLTPKKEECGNLLVPVCLSASHIAYGSIRMEPVFMVLGQSAAFAAAQALDEKCVVQDIDYSKLRSALLAAGQILE